jgi:hypothetical protein
MPVPLVLLWSGDSSKTEKTGLAQQKTRIAVRIFLSGLVGRRNLPDERLFVVLKKSALLRKSSAFSWPLSVVTMAQHHFVRKYTSLTLSSLSFEDNETV